MVFDSDGSPYENFHWLKWRGKYATVLEPAPNSKPARQGTTTMTMYDVMLQRTKTKKTCVCLVSEGNGKLVLKGEPINRSIDAIKVGHSVLAAMGRPEKVLEVLPWNHRWPKNAGPKKAKKK